MAVDTTREHITFIAEVIKSVGFSMTGYAIEPNIVRITTTKDVAGLDEIEIKLSEMRIKNLLEIYGWKIMAAQTAQNNLLVIAEKPRTVTGIA